MTTSVFNYKQTWILKLGVYTLQFSSKQLNLRNDLKALKSSRNTKNDFWTANMRWMSVCALSIVHDNIQACDRNVLKILGIFADTDRRWAKPDEPISIRKRFSRYAIL